MARFKKPGTPRAPYSAQVPPFNDHMRQLYAFATTKRMVRSGGVAKELTHYELVRHKQLETAMAGNSVAQRDVLRQSELAILSREQFVESECETWTRIKDRHQKILDDAHAAKAPLPRVLPHPADIHIDWANGVTIRGPMDEEGWKRIDGLAKFRDALFVQQIMEDADDRVPMDERPSQGAALIHGMLINKRLPASFQMTDFEVDMRIFFLQRLSKREAFVRCREAWKAAGGRVPRGQHYGTLEKLILLNDAEADLCNALGRGNLDQLELEELVEAFIQAIRTFLASAPKRKGSRTKFQAGEEVLA